MDRTAELGARLRDLAARSEATDQAARAALAELLAAGDELTTAMDALADEMSRVCNH
jgi:hypothetical protein